MSNEFWREAAIEAVHLFQTRGIEIYACGDPSEDADPNIEPPRLGAILRFHAHPGTSSDRWFPTLQDACNALHGENPAPDAEMPIHEQMARHFATSRDSSFSVDLTPEGSSGDLSWHVIPLGPDVDANDLPALLLEGMREWVPVLA